MKALFPILVAATGLAVTAAPVDAEGRQHPNVEVTTGGFHTLPGGADLGYVVRGGAMMFRSDHGGGHTAVVIRARGLDPNTTYPTHVHNQPCSATPAGGSHYQQVVGLPVDAANEIWPAITTNRQGGGVGFATHDARARDDAMSIVVHYPLDTSIRLACLDLR